MLKRYLTFTIEDFKLTAYDNIRIEAMFGQLVKDKRVLRGVWRKRQRVGFRLLARMTRARLEDSIVEGCVSWDITLQKLLGVVLTWACGGRPGDVGRAKGYAGVECLAWKDIEISLDGGVEFRHLVMIVELAWTKFKK